MRKGGGTVILYLLDSGNKLRKKFDTTTIIKDLLNDVAKEINVEATQIGLFYCGQFIESDKTFGESNIQTGDTIAIRNREINTNEDTSGRLKVNATLNIPGKYDKTKIEITDVRADAFVYEVKQKLIRKINMTNADEYEIYIDGSRIYDDSILLDELWLRDDVPMLTYREHKQINVELRPRKQRIEPTVQVEEEFEETELEIDTKDDINIWEEVTLNTEEHIKFVNDTKGGGLVLQGATLNKLLERLTGEKEHDLLFMKIFILTYQSFTTPHMFLFKLIQRYNVPSNLDDVTKKTIQLRVGNVLKSWFDLSFSDFEQDNRLFEHLNNFIDIQLTNDNNLKLQTKLREFINRKIYAEKERKKVFTVPAPPPKIPRNLNSADFNFLDLDEEEIARQLTLIEYDTFANIKPAELLNQAWAKPSLQKRAPNVLSMIERFNNVSLWAATMIVKGENLKVRAKMMTKVITIAKYLKQFNNFSTMMALIAGLNNAAISRLSLTKKELTKSTVEDLNNLEQLMSAVSSYKGYRSALHSADPPVIPYMGVYLSDLTFIGAFLIL